LIIHTGIDIEKLDFISRVIRNFKRSFIGSYLLVFFIIPSSFSLDLYRLFYIQALCFFLDSVVSILLIEPLNDAIKERIEVDSADVILAVCDVCGIDI